MGNCGSAKLSSQDMAFLAEMTADVMERSRIRPGEKVGRSVPNSTGGTLIRLRTSSLPKFSGQSGPESHSYDPRTWNISTSGSQNGSCVAQS
ncbi:MAG: hypothetical protein GWP14_02150 [Actinobacteria bacterium]|nr:hypothetical protein [Actinomycetota bacterium]